MDWDTREVKTLKQFISALTGLLPSSSTQKGTYWFRGQSSAEWSLAPSFMRITDGLGLPLLDATGLEVEALKAFKSRAHLFVSPQLLDKVKTAPCWWALMQHHGAPTRLLDWTTSPYVAAYFAAQQGGSKADGAVWCFCSDKLRTKFANRHGEPPDFTSDQADEWYAEKLDELRQERILLPLSFPYVTTERMAAQQGHFTMCFEIHNPHDCIIEQVGTKHIRKIVIPHENKPDILLRLRDMNITGAALFPGIDGLGMSINELVALGGRYTAVV